MLVSLTVGKVDAGVAVLLTDDKRLIEFPSILLPPDISSGSIVDINVSRNFKSEQVAAQRFAALQSDIYQTFGLSSPSAPVLRCRNATQTSLVLEWDPVDLATAELRSLSLYRNGSKAGNIPRDKLSTKISGLAIDTEYTFHLVLRTSAGTYNSERLTVKTHKMTDLTGITVTPGVMPAQLKDSLAETVERIGAKLIDTVRIDTTHFVCTEGRGQAWEKAQELNIPVVVPDWIKGCEREGRVVGVRGYYLNADPKLRQMGTGAGLGSQTQSQPQPQQQQEARPQPQHLRTAMAQDSPRIEHTPPTPEQLSRTRDAVRDNGTPAPTPPPKMEPFPPAPTEMDNAEGSDEEDDAHDQSNYSSLAAAAEAAESEADDESDVSEHTQRAPSVELVNNLKAIGIPHQPSEGFQLQAVPRKKESADAAEGGEAGFDEVDL